MPQASLLQEVPEEPWRLRSGVEALLRPLRPSDLELHWGLFHNCSTQSLYQRFFQAPERSKVTDSEVARFTDFDRSRELAVTAVQTTGGGPELGVVRLVRLGSDIFEFAVLIADPWHRQGLGRKLVQKAIAVAAAGQVRRLEGYVLASNRPMLTLCRQLGFVLERLGGEGLYQVHLEVEGDGCPTVTGSSPIARADR
ncbi:GNAT family N-acetyltransferase [Gloeobacter violaceus]|uniref:Glr1144 protein n=1 Tax=Gloeobacter violaceus (strain ATCC 29082 / PCC 7421) TaxID=251221 RepID=Q7NLH9_GLOVI|nr:GNAT family N-acetyltransferase [Gloeobacter violaceus]BAC89085.1 glr1144 [Gloeobacter violaceus PCC 7421]